jgi:hypothetical protein
MFAGLFQTDRDGAISKKVCLVARLESLRSQTVNLEIATMIGPTASVLLALAMTAAASDREVDTFSHHELAPGQTFEIETADRVYRGRLVDRRTGECQIATSGDGANYSQPQTVYLLGATAGPQARQMLVLMHEVKVGLKMELGVGDLEAANREITSVVRAIKLGG